VLTRDTLSFLPSAGQEKVLADIAEKLKATGVVILGDNERMNDGWEPVGKDGIAAFMRG
jgi:chemotaxis methyl-accepting protein methylase